MDTPSSRRFPFSQAAVIYARKRLPVDSIKLLEELDLSVDSSSIRFIREIGRGVLSTIYEGEIHDKKVAVKVESLTTSMTRQTNLLLELSILQSLSHPRLIKFYGADCCSKQANKREVRIRRQRGTEFDVRISPG